MKKVLSLILGLQLIVSAAQAGGVKCWLTRTCDGVIQTPPVIVELKP